MKNFLNTNDVFPIIEMIRREIKRNNFDRDRIYIGHENPPVLNTDDVLSVELLRGGSSYDPEMINAIVVTYVDGTVETITIIRGANPPVPDTIPDHEFINNVLITGFTVQISSPYGDRVITGQLIRENGYGKIERLDLAYVS